MMDDFQRAQLWEQASVYLSQAYPQGAVMVLRQILSVDPEDAAAHAFLAVALMGTRRLHAARHEATLASGLDPMSPFAHYALGVVETGARRYDRAEQHLREALSISPEDPASLRALGHVHAMRRQYDQARSAYGQALAMEPESSATLVALGDLDFEQGDLAGADARALQALEVDPENADAHALMGQLHLRRGAVDEAKRHAADALRRDPSHRGGLHLFASIKARSSPFLGLWWRWAVWMESLGTSKSILVLLSAFAIYRVAGGLAMEQGRDSWLLPMQVVWLALVAYTWIGPSLLRRSIQRDLNPVVLNKGF